MTSANTHAQALLDRCVRLACQRSKCVLQCAKFAAAFSRPLMVLFMTCRIAKLQARLDENTWKEGSQSPPTASNWNENIADSPPAVDKLVGSGVHVLPYSRGSECSQGTQVFIEDSKGLGGVVIECLEDISRALALGKGFVIIRTGCTA